MEPLNPDGTYDVDHDLPPSRGGGVTWYDKWVGMGDSFRADEIRYDLARDRARGLLTLTRLRPPVDVQAIIDLAGIPVVQRALSDGTRATIGDVAGRRAIILNRKWKFTSENERRFVLAEELGHILMGHKLVESTEPGKPMIGLLEPRRHFYEREARAFAAELLMPFADAAALVRPLVGGH